MKMQRHQPAFSLCRYVQTVLFFACFLLCCGSAGAQASFPESIKKGFLNYSRQAVQERIYVHTDKSFYVAGELLWFKLYLVEGASHQPLALSKVGYVELLDAENKPVLQAKVGMAEGGGNGSFQLPLSLQSGNYLLRAYTNWMKNFGPELYFEKVVSIANTLKAPDWQKLQRSPSFGIDFFPEGGNLVNGLESRVAFKATDEAGNGVACSGVVVSQNGDTVVRFQSRRFGMGSFQLTPLAGTSYKALVKTEKGQSLIKELPPAYPQGYVLQVRPSGEQQVTATVRTNLQPANSLLYLLVHAGQQVKVAQAKEVTNGAATFVMSREELGEGIAHFTLFNSNRQPVCERLYFTPPKAELAIKVQAGEQVYPTREKVALEVQTLNGNGQAVAAGLSLSVHLLDSLQALEEEDLFTYLWLRSNLKGRIESPGYYFTEAGSEAAEARDNLMLTQGWRRFRWEDVLAEKTPAFRFLPEYEGPLVTGKIYDKQSGVPVTNRLAYLSLPGRFFQFHTAVSNEEGRLRFNLKNIHGATELIAQAASGKDSASRIEIDPAFSEQPSSTLVPPLHLQQQWQPLLEKRGTAMQLQYAYGKERYQRFSLPLNADTLPFYGVPDKRYVLDDYTRFTTMEEVMREYVTEVRVRRNNNAFYYQVFNLPYQSFFEEEPLVLFNGVPVFRTDKVISFDPLKVQRIDVAARRFNTGPLVHAGVVSYATYDGDLAGFELNPEALVLEYEGLQLHREFYAPTYETPAQKGSRLPDFRNLLYWNPDVVSGADGRQQLSFYTSDLPGTYAVVVQGITASGKSGSTVYTFRVEKEKR